jgi:hypothetical protein
MFPTVEVVGSPSWVYSYCIVYSREYDVGLRSQRPDVVSISRPLKLGRTREFSENDVFNRVIYQERFNVVGHAALPPLKPSNIHNDASHGCTRDTYSVGNTCNKNSVRLCIKLSRKIQKGEVQIIRSSQQPTQNSRASRKKERKWQTICSSVRNIKLQVLQKEICSGNPHQKDG